MAKRLFYLDLVTNKRNSIGEAKLNKQLDNLVALIEKHATKLKKVNGGTLESFQATFGITSGFPVLSASGGLTLSYHVEKTR
jgi:hypothetical protein